MVSFPCLLRLRALVLKKWAKELFSGRIEQIKQIDKHEHFQFSIDCECFSIHFYGKYLTARILVGR